MSTTLKRYAGFTLAEVLITLGIIGVVAALTIPTLIGNYQKSQTVSQLKKSYTTLSQAIKQSELDNGNNADWDWGISGNAASIRQSFDTYWAPYLKIIKYCANASACNYSNQQAKDLNGNNIGWYMFMASETSVILSDGTFLGVIWDGFSKIIIVDINAAKGPNMEGKDIFVFQLDKDRGFMPCGYTDNLATLNARCIKTGDPSYCAAKIMKEDWEITNDYPWN